jgi:hypothetical protein
MANDHFQAGDGSGPPIADSIFSEAQNRLRQHRQQADEAVAADQQRLALRIRRRSLISALCAAAMITPAVVGVRWLGLPLGMLIGTLFIQLHHRQYRSYVIVAIGVGIALLGSLPFLAQDKTVPTALGISIGLLGLMGLFHAITWIAAPATALDHQHPTGALAPLGRFTPPTQLVTHGKATQAVALHNFAVGELKHRSSLILVVLLGMAAAWSLHPLCTIAGGDGGWSGGIGSDPAPARIQSLLALVGGVAAVVISRTELAVPLGMLVYGLGVSGIQILAIFTGLCSFTAWTSLWVWLAWICTGGLAMLTEHRHVAVPQRVT